MSRPSTNTVAPTGIVRTSSVRLAAESANDSARRRPASIFTRRSTGLRPGRLTRTVTADLQSLEMRKAPTCPRS